MEKDKRGAEKVSLEVPNLNPGSAGGPRSQCREPGRRPAVGGRAGCWGAAHRGTGPTAVHGSPAAPSSAWVGRQPPAARRARVSSSLPPHRALGRTLGCPLMSWGRRRPDVAGPPAMPIFLPGCQHSLSDGHKVSVPSFVIVLPRPVEACRACGGRENVAQDCLCVILRQNG